MAEAFYREAARHLQDARVLHRSQRHPGSITSSMKAVELGLKSLLIVDGATGWMAEVFKNHQIFAEISSQKNQNQANLMQNFLAALTAYDADLPFDIGLLEKLVPFKPDINKLEISQAANTEYPFFASVRVPVPSASPSIASQLYLPETYFTSDEGMKHFGTAHRLLSALQALSPEIKDWKVRLCRPL